MLTRLLGLGANPKYCGETLFESLRNSLNKDVQTFFDENYGRSFCFDGDTIEFVTQNFYCTTVDECIEEFVTFKEKFLQMLELGFYWLHKKEKWLEGKQTFFKSFSVCNFFQKRNFVLPPNQSWNDCSSYKQKQRDDFQQRDISYQFHFTHSVEF